MHEFGHAVMNLTFGRPQAERIWALYADAMALGRYRRSAYIMDNEEEYWATGEARCSGEVVVSQMCQRRGVLVI